MAKKCKTPAIKQRLISQLKSNGKSTAAAHAIATSALKKSGNLDKSGCATAKGKKRGKMTPAQRAKQRAAKYSGGKASDYSYKAENNTAVKNRKSLKTKVKRYA
jgi:hypothetical protein